MRTVGKRIDVSLAITTGVVQLILSTMLVLASRRMHSVAAFLQPRTINFGGVIINHSGSSHPSFPHHPAQVSRRYFQQKWSNPSLKQQKDADQETPNKPSRIKKLKNKNKKKSKSKQLFRAERVLANRSGRSRAECHKLLTKYAISILEEDENEDEPPTSTTETVDASRLRVISSKEQIPMTARIFINKKFEVPSVPPLLMVFHKPKWMLSTMGSDARERRNLQNLRFSWSTQMHPVGRLDYDTSGLLLFSSSGKLTQKLLHPKFEKQKEYVAIVTGTVQEEALRAHLQKGIELADIQTRGNRSKKDPQTNNNKESSDDSGGDVGSNRDTFTTRAELLNVQHWPEKDVTPYLKNIRATLPPEYNATDLNLRGYMDQLDAKELSEIRIVVQEGKHRMVRRMLASCGHPVVSLKRERIGVIELGSLPEGSFRNITTEEQSWAKSVVETKG